jgi:ABC-type multidrug transport system fused ATPase/permease subunit
MLEAVRWREDQTPRRSKPRRENRSSLWAQAVRKSMLLRWAARLLDPAFGRVLLDGTPLSEVKDLHRVVQLVSPEVPLLRGTVRRNLEYGLDPEGGLAVEEVAEVLYMLGESALFPNGLNTSVAEGGSNLPTGAQARTLLGRALLANPRLLLLDDAAFLLDEGTGRALREALTLVRATVLLAGAERPWPIVPTSVWRLSASGACIARALETAPVVTQTRC